MNGLSLNIESLEEHQLQSKTVWLLPKRKNELEMAVENHKGVIAR